MARVRMVTRTIISTVVRVKVADDTLDTIDTRTVEIPLELKNDVEAKKACIKYYKDNANLTVLSAKIEGTTSLIYGMTESDFIKLAKVLPTRS